MTCFPLDNKEYTAEALGAWYGIRSRGVFSGEGHFQVSCPGGMKVTVAPGIAWLKKSEWWGVVVCEQSATTLELEPCHATLHRIDAVCLRLDKNANRAELVIKKGVEAADPMLYSPTRNNTCDEIYLARISVPAGVLAITSAYVSDLRLDEAFCGVVRDGVSGIPTQSLQSQAAGLIAQVEEQLARLSDDDEIMLKGHYAPDATAAVQGGKLVVTSRYPRAGGSYSLEFDAPEAYDPEKPVAIDGADMQGLFTPAGVALSAGAWGFGCPVQLTRRGNKAFFKQGGAATGLRVRSGATVPQNPEENLIFVQSFLDVPATTQRIFYGFSPPELSAVNNGDLFVLCGQGNLEVHSPDQLVGLCPVGVLQKQAGGWVPMPAMMWRDGAWRLMYRSYQLHNLSPLDGSTRNAINTSEVITRGAACVFTTDATAGTVLLCNGSENGYANYTSLPYTINARGKTILFAVKPLAAADGNLRNIVSTGVSSGGIGMGYISGKVRLHQWNTPYVDSTATLEANGWNVVALAQDTALNTIQLYVNGEAQGALTGVSTTPTTGRITIGGTYGSYSATTNLNGHFSHLFWYSACLPADEICCLSRSLRAKLKGEYA